MTSSIKKFGMIHEDQQGRLVINGFSIELDNQFSFPHGKEIGMLKLIIERLQSELNTFVIKSTREQYINSYKPQPASKDEIKPSNVIFLVKKEPDPNE